MTATYRCCCDQECTWPRCCLQWCECPEFITVTTAKQVVTTELFSCGNLATNNACLSGMVDGTPLGSRVCTVQAVNIRFQKFTCPAAFGQTFCEYRAVVGSGQTGTLEVSIDANWPSCYDSRLNDDTGECECAIYDSTCLGSAVMSLSGLSATNLIGILSFGCCAPVDALPAPGDDDSETCTCQPELRLLIQNATGGYHTFTPACTECGQQTVTGLLGGVLDFRAVWPRLHRSRYQNTCPADLNDLDPVCSNTAQVCTDCLAFPFDDNRTCPCGPQQGQFGMAMCAKQGINSCDSFSILDWCQVTTDTYLGSRCVTIGP